MNEFENEAANKFVSNISLTTQMEQAYVKLNSGRLEQIENFNKTTTNEFDDTRINYNN